MEISPARRVLVPLGVGLAISLLGDQTLYTVLPHPQIAAQAGVAMGMVGVLLGINRLTRVLTNTPVGFLYSRLPRRGLMLASMCIAALSTMLYTSGEQALFLLGRVLWGLAWSGIWIGSNMVALDISNREDRGGITGRLQSWFFLGIGFASLAGGVFTDTFGFRSGLWVSAALTALAVLLWLFFLPETRPSAQEKESQTARAVDILPTQVDNQLQPSSKEIIHCASTGERSVRSSSAQEKESQTARAVDTSSTQVDDRLQPLRSGFNHAEVVPEKESPSPPVTTRGNAPPSFPWKVALQASVPLFALRLVFAGVLTSTTILWLAQFVESGIALSGLFLPLATLTGGFVAVRVLLSMLSAPLSGNISDRIGSRWLVLAVVLFLGAAGMWLMGSLWVAAALGGAALATMSAGSLQGLVPALVGDRVGTDQQSKALGVVYTIADLGSAIGPLVGLALVPLLGLGYVYHLCALLFVLVGVYAAIIALKERRLGESPGLSRPPF